MEQNKIDFEREGVTKLFFKMLFPTLLGTLSLSAVTAIDGIFVGHGVGAYGVAAINIACPIYQVLAGLGLMVGMGCSVTCAILLSKGSVRESRLRITQSIAFCAVMVALFCLVVECFPTSVARLLGASDTLLPDVVDYLRYITPCFVFEMFSLIGLFIIRLDGAPRYAMWCNVVPGILNVVLDWLFIFPLQMGVKGASIATSISICVGGIMALAYLLNTNNQLHMVRLRCSAQGLRKLLLSVCEQSRIGFSSMLGELSLAVLIVVGNLTFMAYLGDDGVGAFGIACYYTPFFFMVGNAVAQSAQPIISFNYGLSRWSHVIAVRRLLLLTSLVLGIVVTALFVFIPERLVALFVDVNSVAGQLAIVGFPYFAVGIVFFILNIAVIGYYQSIERMKRANLLVLLRGALLLIPAFVFLPHVLGVPGIWLAMPLAELLTLLIYFLPLLWRRHKYHIAG